jgi:X-X-X-Leu-X-X-Gly heptad repeat protein
MNRHFLARPARSPLGAGQLRSASGPRAPPRPLLCKRASHPRAAPSDGEAADSAEEPTLRDVLLRLDSLGRDLDKNMSQLSRDMSKLDRGVSKLSRNMSELDRGVSKLSRNMSELDRGISQLGSGVSKLDRGISQLSSGVSELGRGVGQLGSGMSETEALLGYLVEDSLRGKAAAVVGPAYVEPLVARSLVDLARMWPPGYAAKAAPGRARRPPRDPLLRTGHLAASFASALADARVPLRLLLGLRPQAMVSGA